MNMGSSSYRVRDPWSRSLFKAASNRSEFIEKYIETISHTRKYDYITIESEFSNEIDSAIKESRKLFPNYAQSKIKGAFIEKVQKDGEMQSFLKIREYIEESSVKQVIIVDPYFSIDAVAKILTRISHRNVQIEVITSLVNTNPDTGNVTDMSESKRLEKFLRKNATLLHPHLLVCNLKRGVGQVFHDRYLLRYFEDGRIDGFLLSNSLNSMGQFYPFVIAPMEYEVCLEVISYLEFMRDDVVQSTVNKKERITCEVLYDSKKKEQVYQQDAKGDFFRLIG